MQARAKRERDNAKHQASDAAIMNAKAASHSGRGLQTSQRSSSPETQAPQGFERCVTNYLQNDDAMFQFGLPWHASRKMFLLRQSPFALFQTAITSTWSCPAPTDTTTASSKWRGPATLQSRLSSRARMARRSAKPNFAATKAPSAGIRDFLDRLIFIAAPGLPGHLLRLLARKHRDQSPCLQR